MDISQAAAKPLSKFDLAAIIALGFLIAMAFAATVYSACTFFIVSADYTSYNRNVAYACGVIGAISGLYIGLTLRERLRKDAWLGLLALGAMFGYMAALNGVPAIAAGFAGSPGRVVFTVSQVAVGGRNCSNGIAMSNPGYETKTLCGVNGVGGRPRLRVGDMLEVSGPVSYWGMRYEDFRLLGRTN